VYEILFPNAGLSIRKQNTGDVILQIPSSLWPTSYYMYEITNSDKNPTTEHPSGK